MNKYKKMQLISILSLMILLCGCGKKTESEVMHTSFNITHEFNQKSDTYDINEALFLLNIEENKILPYNVYKVIWFVDINNHEKVAVVSVHDNFNVGKFGDITSYSYTLKDIFNNNFILNTKTSTNGKMILEDLEHFGILKVLLVGELLDLKTIAFIKGMDENYINSVMPDEIKDRSISLEDAGKMYVMLINSNNRIKYDNKLKMILE